MMITVWCDRTDCYCNEDGYCCADAGLHIDEDCECDVYESVFDREGASE